MTYKKKKKIKVEMNFFIFYIDSVYYIDFMYTCYPQNLYMLCVSFALYIESYTLFKNFLQDFLRLICVFWVAFILVIQYFTFKANRKQNLMLTNMFYIFVRRENRNSKFFFFNNLHITERFSYV